MVKIYKRNGTWHVYYRLAGKRYRYSLETANERVAQDQLKKIEYELMMGQHLGPRQTPIADFLQDLLEHLKGSISHRHYRSRRSHLRAAFGDIVPELVDHAPGQKTIKHLSRESQRMTIKVRLLEDLSVAALAKYLEGSARLKNWAPATYNKARETFHLMFEYAIRVHEYVSPDPRYPNPIKAIPRRKNPAPHITFLELNDIDGQLAALEDYPMLRTAVGVMIYTGIRRGEVVWLHKTDVDLKANLIRIRPKRDGDVFWQPKTKTNRVVPISTELRRLLDEYASPEASVWYFPAPKQQMNRWDEDNLSRMLRMVNARHELSWTALEFRHTFGSHLARNNISLYKIATLMGNSPEICRRHYAALIPEELTDCVEFRGVKESAVEYGTPSLRVVGRRSA